MSMSAPSAMSKAASTSASRPFAGSYDTDGDTDTEAEIENGRVRDTF